jgi:hypothetical protein
LASVGALAIGCLGVLSRFILAALSTGCDDARIWREHADVIAAHGVRFAYENVHPASWQYNHPPLMGYWSALARKMSHSDLHVFSLWIKAPGLLVELLSATLVYRIWAARSPTAAPFAFAAYGLSLPLILVSGYHANTDCAYAGLTLLAVYLMHEKSKPFASGIALAAALNVKLMPLFLIPVLASQCRSWRSLLRFAGGLSIAIIPYVPFLVTVPRAVYTNMVAYNSQQLDWGIMAFLNAADKMEPFAHPAARFTELFVPSARYVILVSVIAISAVAAIRRRPLGYELGALAWALFLVLTPGYGVQYSVCVLPLLFVADLKRAVIYSLTAGLMLLAVYTKQMHLTLPLQADVQYYPFPPVGVLFGVLAWGTLVRFTVTTVRRIWESPPLAPSSP